MFEQRVLGTKQANVRSSRLALKAVAKEWHRMIENNRPKLFFLFSYLEARLVDIPESIAFMLGFDLVFLKFFCS